MSANEVKKNSRAKANAVAAWEWFKSAAWLQVLLIVGVVVGIVVSIPYIVDAVNSISDESNFFESRSINYNTLVSYRDGTGNSSNYGSVGNERNGKDEDKEGFAVLFFKDNCANCDSIESYVEDWYNLTNSSDTYKDSIRLYTLNVGWVPGDSDESATAEGGDTVDYENNNISIEEQQDYARSIRNVYRNQPERYRTSEVTYEQLSSEFCTDGGLTTLPTPLMVMYTRTVGSTDAFEPVKVFGGALSGLSWDRNGVNEMMDDLYYINLYYGN